MVDGRVLPPESGLVLKEHALVQRAFDHVLPGRDLGLGHAVDPDPALHDGIALQLGPRRPRTLEAVPALPRKDVGFALRPRVALAQHPVRVVDEFVLLDEGPAAVDPDAAGSVPAEVVTRQSDPAPAVRDDPVQVPFEVASFEFQGCLARGQDARIGVAVEPGLFHPDPALVRCAQADGPARFDDVGFQSDPRTFGRIDPPPVLFEPVAGRCQTRRSGAFDPRLRMSSDEGSLDLGFGHLVKFDRDLPPQDLAGGEGRGTVIDQFQSELIVLESGAHDPGLAEPAAMDADFSAQEFAVLDPRGGEVDAFDPLQEAREPSVEKRGLPPVEQEDPAPDGFRSAPEGDRGFRRPGTFQLPFDQDIGVGGRSGQVPVETSHGPPELEIGLAFPQKMDRCARRYRERPPGGDDDIAVDPDLSLPGSVFCQCAVERGRFTAGDLRIHEVHRLYCIWPDLSTNPGTPGGICYTFSESWPASCGLYGNKKHGGLFQ